MVADVRPPRRCRWRSATTTPTASPGSPGPRTPPRSIKRSSGLEYAFDPTQDTKLHAGSKVWVAGIMDSSFEITGMDEDAGLVEIKVGPKKTLPDRLCLIDNEFVGAENDQGGRRPLRRGMGAGRGRLAGGRRPAAPPPAADRGPHRRTADPARRRSRDAHDRPGRPPRRRHPLHPGPARHREDHHRGRHHPRPAAPRASTSASPPTATR